MTSTTLTTTKMQQEGIDKIQAWFKNKSKQFFMLTGYAGTGKTWMILAVIEQLGININEVCFATFTGKAALVMSQKSNGMYRAYTTHKVIYEPDIDSKGNVTFIRRSKLDLDGYKLIVIDEWSMIPDEIYNDLAYFGKPILAIGDPAQLPPINESSMASQMLLNPDHMLTEIHRQAEGNPIIHLSMLARQGKRIPEGHYGDKVMVTRKRDCTDEFLKGAYLRSDQVICGYNKTREHLNASMRQWLGFNGSLPQKGDKLICVKNNWHVNIPETALVNGLSGTVNKIFHNLDNDYRDMVMDFTPDFTDSLFHYINVQKNSFQGKNPEYRQTNSRAETCFFEFGYAITCHKSQGSQWDKLTVVNEAFGNEPWRWLYTAVTRSADKLILLQ